MLGETFKESFGDKRLDKRRIELRCVAIRPSFGLYIELLISLNSKNAIDAIKHTDERIATQRTML